LASLGEYTEVASANLGVWETLSEVSEDEVESLGSLVKGMGGFFSLFAILVVSLLYRDQLPKRNEISPRQVGWPAVLWKRSA
jgi:hypothetical protein